MLTDPLLNLLVQTIEVATLQMQRYGATLSAPTVTSSISRLGQIWSRKGRFRDLRGENRLEKFGRKPWLSASTNAVL